MAAASVGYPLKCILSLDAKVCNSITTKYYLYCLARLFDIQGPYSPRGFMQNWVNALGEYGPYSLRISSQSLPLLYAALFHSEWGGCKEVTCVQAQVLFAYSSVVCACASHSHMCRRMHKRYLHTFTHALTILRKARGQDEKWRAVAWKVAAKVGWKVGQPAESGMEAQSHKPRFSSDIIPLDFAI